MARRKAKVRPEESLLGNMDQETDREWIALNRSANRLPASLESTNATTAPTTVGAPSTTRHMLADRSWSKLGIAVELRGLAKPRVSPLSSNVGMRRQANNIASCEKTLQENDPETWSRKTGVSSYAILHSEPNLRQIDSSSEESTSAENAASVADNTTVTDAGKIETVNPSAEETQVEGGRGPTSNSSRDQLTQRRSLLHYFAKITSSNEVDVTVDLEYMKILLDGGACVNESDDFGQTLLHEVSRVWGVDVAKFFVDEGQYSKQRQAKVHDHSQKTY